ncbi:ATP-binding cassette domain-containing protein [Pediococcus parvulus]|uniref:ATP-binding cassette domain-containing protein n=1 Tax=Pediococcus parvulus TaxID=54062 RepID=A0AAP5WGR5_9LACO|nr:ATP-binding cassette domain-containing protein [Pediococcus parvulus]
MQSNDVSTIYNEGFFLQDLFNFLDLNLTSISKLKTKNKKSLTQEDFDSVSNGETIIEFKHVKFDYPNSNQHVLNDIFFSIKKGEKVFLVGANGVGKTTIIDCLLGLYPIDKGTILILGKNLEQIDPVSLKENFSVIFQNYIRYNLTLKDNIILKEKYNKKKFDDTIKESNLNFLVDRLSKKEETYLGKMFIAGEDLSGGQWQKVALARSIYKNSNIFILDEPTASLDAETENDVYSLMREEKKEKTIIFTSHRLAFAKMADRVLLIENGTVAAFDTHDNLMNANDHYRSMFNMQSGWYD